MQATQIPDFDPSAPADLAEEQAPVWRRPLSRLSLFWRTFFLLAILLIGSILAWLQTLRALEFEPRAVQTAQLLASQVNLSRAALVYADGIARISLIKTMKDEEGLRIVPRDPADTFESKNNDAFSRRVVQELGTRLGPNTIVASNMNGQPGLWVSFMINEEPYWLQTDETKFNPAGGTTWLIWLMVATVMSLAGAALIARLINRPLKDLSFAASRMREGDFMASQLDEHVNTSEIREVNIGFNRMAQKLAKVEQDRALMLAGISHDLRTPLARLRLETELSVGNEEARAHMAADISQLDAIIDKFLDYARPDRVSLTPIVLGDVVDSCIFSMRKLPDVRIEVDLDSDILVHADEVELGRVLTNLLENARRYGKTVYSGIAEIRVSAVVKDKWVLVKVRDHGIGVAPEQLYQLTQPFFRGEAARTAANGAGLGLAIVEKTMQRMGGSFHVANSASGGLTANLRLQRATRF